jgi:hypothetical protein
MYSLLRDRNNALAVLMISGSSTPASWMFVVEYAGSPPASAAEADESARSDCRVAAAGMTPSSAIPPPWRARSIK